MSLFGRRQFIEPEGFSTVIADLTRQLESLREDYVFGSLSQLKREGIDVSRLPRQLTPGSELDDILKGYQLTCVVGIAWKYIRECEQMRFDRQLSSSMGAEIEASGAWNYRDRYMNCGGDIDALAKALSHDVHRALGSPQPGIEFLIQFQAGGQLLGCLSQAATYSACGDQKSGRKLRQIMGIP